MEVMSLPHSPILVGRHPFGVSDDTRFLTRFSLCQMHFFYCNTVNYLRIPFITCGDLSSEV